MENILNENIVLTKIVSIFIAFLEVVISKTFFIYAFKLELSRIKACLFFCIYYPLQVLSIIFMPIIAFPIVNLYITFTCLFLFFKNNFTHNFFILLIPLSLFQLLKLFFVFILAFALNISPLILMRIPIVRPIIILPTYCIIFAILHHLKKIDIANKLSCNLNLASKIVINLFSFLCLFFVFINNYLLILDFSGSVFAFLLLNMSLISILILLIFKTLDLHKTELILDCEKKSYSCLANSYDGIRSFKHDFSNIMQSIGGYLMTDDLEGLKIYYSSIFKDCEELKKLSLFNKDVLNSPPVLSLITEKYYKAKNLGIDFNIEVFVDLNSLNMNIYEFTRILGIFLDNSIEAANLSKKKTINIMIVKDTRNHFDSLVIENSYEPGVLIDTNKIFEKNYSTKPKNTGLGLWKVKNILKKYNNISLNTTVTDTYFRHQLKIYY